MEVFGYMKDVLLVFKEPMAYGFGIMLGFGILVRVISLFRSING